MINEVLKNVRDAEEKADEIRKNAEEKAGRIRADADAYARENAAQAKKNVRAKRDNALVTAGLAAEREYLKTLSANETENAKMKEEYSSKTDELAKEIFGRIINGDL